MILLGWCIGAALAAVDCLCLIAHWAMIPTQIHLFPLTASSGLILCGTLMRYIDDMFILARRVERGRVRGVNSTTRELRLVPAPVPARPQPRIPRHRRDGQ